MKPPLEMSENPEKGTCWRCGTEMDRKLLGRCPWCFRDFCHACRFPRGAADYCSRACGEAMFHGGDSEDEGSDDEIG